MITATFRHIRGVGGLRERQLWVAGVRGWDFLPEGPLLAPALDRSLREGVRESRERLAADDLDHFARALPVTEHWRLLPHLLAWAAFLDVETGSDPDEVSVASVLDEQGPRCFVRGKDLQQFLERAGRWRCLVTFNGLAFDLPALRRTFPSWTPPAAHIDLRHLLARVGERGGLKEVEERFGLSRPPHLRPLRGSDAVALWQAQRRGDRNALRRLVEYNLTDAFHLRPLAEMAYNRAVLRMGMPAPALPVTPRGAYLYDVSQAVEQALG